MGIDFVALNGNGLCCGAGRYMVGDIEGTKTAAEELVTNIMAFSPKHVIFECSGCYAWYRFTAPKFMAVPFQSEHTTQYLRNNLDKIKFMRHIDKTVTYHDHCSLGKNAGEFDAPRELLQAIPGIKLVEMEHTMKDSLCCGGPANWSGFGNVTSKYRATRLEEARSVGAELLITTCAGCYTAYVGLDHKYPLSVMGIIELLGEAMGISYQNKYREYVYNDSISTIIEDSWNTIRANGLDPEKMSVMLNMYLADARSLQP
jgi:Fe-S oxidoreductase